MQPPGRFDPWLIICQIVSLQALHYVTLSIILPPLLLVFTDPTSLNFYHGGAATVGMVMDWREMAGRPSIGPGVEGGSWNPFESAWDGVLRVKEPDSKESTGTSAGLGGWKSGVGSHSKDASASKVDAWHLAVDGLDPRRAWTIAAGWLLACAADIYYLYIIVRKPTWILDFALTLVWNHLILTTYYASFPSSLFFWLIMTVGSVFVIVCAETLCVRREMSEDLSVKPALAPSLDNDEEGDITEDMELLERGGTKGVE